MFKKFNIQYIFSYFGLIPYFFIIIDKYFLFQIKEEIFINFLIYYSLLIFVFIGAINWNLEEKLKNYIVFYGFLPSFFSVIIIVLNLNNLNFKLIIVSLILLLLFQLLLDYILIYYKKLNKNPFYFLRLPLTLMITMSLILIII